MTKYYVVSWQVNNSTYEVISQLFKTREEAERRILAISSGYRSTEFRITEMHLWA